MSASSTATRPAAAKARANGSAKKEVEQPLDVKEHDFFWTYTEEPHRTRRMAIIKAHPEVGSGDDPGSKLPFTPQNRPD